MMEIHNFIYKNTKINYHLWSDSSLCPAVSNFLIWNVIFILLYISSVIFRHFSYLESRRSSLKDQISLLSPKVDILGNLHNLHDSYWIINGVFLFLIPFRRLSQRELSNTAIFVTVNG